VMCIQLHVDENILLADFQALQDNSALQFVIGQKPYNTAPTWYYTAGGGITGFFTTGATSVLNNGIAGNNAANPREINICDRQPSQLLRLVQWRAVDLGYRRVGRNRPQGHDAA